MSTTKVLIQTLSQMPDIELLLQLFETIKKTDSLVIPDIRKLFDMISNLYSCKDDKIISKTFQLNQHINKIMLKTQVQVSWQHIGKSLVRLCGQENSETRKKARHLVLEIMAITNNTYMVLEKFYYDGLEDESIIVEIYSIKMVFKILQLTPNILAKKSCISIIKLTLQKIIRLTNSNHTDLHKNAHHFLHRLFFLKIQRMDQVLQRIDPFYLKSLQSIWQKNKQNLLYKSQEKASEQVKQVKEIKYEHLPLINDKFFGVYEPFVIKNLFNPETHSAHKYAITQFKQLFFEHSERLTKYINSVCKLIMKLLPEKSLELLQLLSHILSLPGITNIINLNELSQELIAQLESQNVPYRRELRQIMRKFNYMSSSQQVIIKKYQQALENDGEQLQNWLKIYQILCLIEHWCQNADALQCYPPTLNFVVKYISVNLKHKIIKVQQQSQKLLYFILEKFSGYRENLEEYFQPKIVGQLEDILEERRRAKQPESLQSKQSKQTFIKEFNQQRLKFLKNKRK